MQYLLTEVEMEEMRERNEYRGYAKAEDLLLLILNGERKLFINQPKNPQPQPLGNYRENVWKQLIDRLDGVKE